MDSSIVVSPRYGVSSTSSQTYSFRATEFVHQRPSRPFGPSTSVVQLPRPFPHASPSTSVLELIVPKITFLFTTTTLLLTRPSANNKVLIIVIVTASTSQPQVLRNIESFKLVLSSDALDFVPIHPVLDDSLAAPTSRSDIAILRCSLLTRLAASARSRSAHLPLRLDGFCCDWVDFAAAAALAVPRCLAGTHIPVFVFFVLNVIEFLEQIGVADVWGGFRGCLFGAAEEMFREFGAIVEEELFAGLDVVLGEEADSVDAVY